MSNKYEKKKMRKYLSYFVATPNQRKKNNKKLKTTSLIEPDILVCMYVAVVAMFF